MVPPEDNINNKIVTTNVNVGEMPDAGGDGEKETENVPAILQHLWFEAETLAFLDSLPQPPKVECPVLPPSARCRLLQ